MNVDLSQFYQVFSMRALNIWRRWNEYFLPSIRAIPDDEDLNAVFRAASLNQGRGRDIRISGYGRGNSDT